MSLFETVIWGCYWFFVLSVYAVLGVSLVTGAWLAWEKFKEVFYGEADQGTHGGAVHKR